MRQFPWKVIFVSLFCWWSLPPPNFPTKKPTRTLKLTAFCPWKLRVGSWIRLHFLGPPSFRCEVWPVSGKVIGCWRFSFFEFIIIFVCLWWPLWPEDMENLCILCIDVKVAYLQIPANIISLKHPETNSSSLKMDGWKTFSSPFGAHHLFRGYVMLVSGRVIFIIYSGISKAA